MTYCTTVMETKLINDDTGEVIAEGTDEADESILEFSSAELVGHGVVNVRIETRVVEVQMSGKTVTFNKEE